MGGDILPQGGTMRNADVRGRAEDSSASFALTYEIQHPVLDGLAEVTSKPENLVKP